MEPPEKIMGMIHDLCDIAGYDIDSGIQTGPKAEEAANYILAKLHDAGLTGARLEPIKANSPYPKKFEVAVEAEGQKSQRIPCFPL
ncbi:MAG: hypothetical protein JSV40_06415, partial [Deltaproteobacteria bacterium]